VSIQSVRRVGNSSNTLEPRKGAGSVKSRLSPCCEKRRMELGRGRGASQWAYANGWIKTGAGQGLTTTEVVDSANHAWYRVRICSSVA
jgi:hypothetical protein